MKKTIFNQKRSEVTLDGMITIGKYDNNHRTLNFECCEDVETEAFVGRFKVQGMTDGNLYMTELPKRSRNIPLLRQENSTLSLGRNGMFYYIFKLPESELSALPEMLLKEARQAARKFIKMYINNQK